MLRGDDSDRLMEAVAAGDFTAFEELYERFHRLVYTIALRVVHDHGAAEDIVQSVFLDIWTKPESFRGGALRRWLVVVARNRSVDSLRSSQPEQSLDDVRAQFADLNLERDIVVRIDAQRARTAMQRLPREQREPIELAFFGGFTHVEIATTTATPLGTVKTRIRNGLRALRSVLGEEWVT